MSDSFEQLSEDLIKVLTQNNLELVQRYMDLKKGVKKEVPIPPPPGIGINKETLISSSQAGSAKTLNLGVALGNKIVKDADIPASPINEDEPLF